MIPDETSTGVRVWDLPARIVHWSLAILVATSWWTAENGDLQLHRYSGYGVLGLLLFRLYWAFAGSATSRLFAYLRSPHHAFAYVRTLAARHRRPRDAGHNPLGAWNAFALILLLLMQVSLGLFAVDVDGVESGPLSHLVSFDAGRTCAEWHEDIFDVLVVFIALHVAAVLFYLFYRRENLIGPMISGVRGGARGAPPIASWARAVLGAALAALATWSISSGFWT